MSVALRHSKHRESLLNLLKSVKSHPSAEWLYSELKKENQNISLATIYRNLNQLYDYGEIIKLDIGDGIEHYDATTHDHCHFICTNCKSVIDIDIPSATNLNSEAEKLNDILVNKSNLFFYGLCPTCK